MNRKFFSLICIIFLFVLCSCSDGGEKQSDYAYYFAVDKGENGKAVMYAVMKDGKRKDENVCLETIEGEDINDVFTRFFDKFNGVYTGTVKEYVVSEELGETGMKDFKTYLTNSPKLPAKRKTVSVKNAADYAYEKMKEEKEESERNNEKD